MDIPDFMNRCLWALRELRRPPGIMSQAQNNIGHSVPLLKSNGLQFEGIISNRPSNDVDGSTVNIALGVSPVPPELPGAPQDDRFLHLVGRCNFGAGGVQLSVEFDWKNGTQFSIPATSFDISGAFEVIGDETPDSITLQVCVTYGCRAARAQMTRTLRQQSIIESGESTALVWPVPPFAQSIYIFSDNPAFYTSANFTIDFLGGPLATDRRFFRQTPAQLSTSMHFEDGTRFPEQARFVRVTATAGAGTTFNLTPTFVLNL